MIESTVKPDLIALIQLLISLEIQPIGITGGPLSDRRARFNSPWFLLTAICDTVKPTREQVVEAPVATEKVAKDEDKVAAVEAPIIRHVTSYHNEILRTGRMRESGVVGDIIINAGINSGSEAIASEISYLWQCSW